MVDTLEKHGGQLGTNQVFSNQDDEYANLTDATMTEKEVEKSKARFKNIF